MAGRTAVGGTLVLGGGFAGGYVARLLGKHGATIVSPENFMLYTPMLPEAASAADGSWSTPRYEWKVASTSGHWATERASKRGDARPLEGDRRSAAPPPTGIPGVVRDAHLPPLPAAARHAKAPRRHRLDHGALLPPRHRRAQHARPPAATRAVTSAGLVGVVAQRHFTQARDCAYPYVVFLMPHTASALGGRMPAAKPEFGSATARAVLLTAKSDIRPSDPSLPRKKNKLAAQVAMPLVPRLAEMK
jgi:hypothetical protein